MISIMDSDGFQLLLDTADYDERGLLSRVRRDHPRARPRRPGEPQHLRLRPAFLARRARALGRDLALGRDGTAPAQLPGRGEGRRGRRTASRAGPSPGARWWTRSMPSSATAPSSATCATGASRRPRRYFGVAREGREYVRGAEIWSTFQEDPERVRRYRWTTSWRWTSYRGCCWAPASRWPRWSRSRTSGSRRRDRPGADRAAAGAGLPEPVARCPAAPRAAASAGARTELFTSGVVQHVVKADVASLYPSLMLTYKIGPRSIGGRVPGALARADRAAPPAQGRGPAPPAGSHDALPRRGLRWR